MGGNINIIVVIVVVIVIAASASAPVVVERCGCCLVSFNGSGVSGGGYGIAAVVTFSYGITNTGRQTGSGNTLTMFQCEYCYTVMEGHFIKFSIDRRIA